MFMDLSKAFNTFNHSGLFEKLNVCGLSFNKIELIQVFFVRTISKGR